MSTGSSGLVLSEILISVDFIGSWSRLAGLRDPRLRSMKRSRWWLIEELLINEKGDRDGND